MPSPTVALLSARTAVNPDLDWATRAFGGAQGLRYKRYRDYLNGDQPLALASVKFAAAFGSLFAAFSYNRCPNVVDAHADAMQITGFHAENADAIVQIGKNIWDANDMDNRAGMVHAEAFGMADGYLLVDKHPVTGDVQYWPQNAADIRVRWAEDVPNRVELAAKRWINNDGFARMNLYYAGRIEKYIGVRAISAPATDASAWDTLTTVYADGSAWQRYQGPLDVSWPVPLAITDTVPIFHFGNNARINSYGRSELADVLPLQDGMNKALADLMVAEEFAAYAQRVLLNVDDGDPETQAAIRQFQLGVDRLLALSSSGDKPASIAEFSAAQMAQFELVVELYERLISRVTAVPLHYLTQAGDFASGRAMRLSMTRWIGKIEDRQRAFGATWAEAHRYGVRLATGLALPRGFFATKWTSAAPMGEEDLLDVALQKRALGYPLEAALEDMGVSPERIAEIRQQIADAADQQAAIFARGAVPTTTVSGDAGDLVTASDGTVTASQTTREAA